MKSIALILAMILCGSMLSGCSEQEKPGNEIIPLPPREEIILKPTPLTPPAETPTTPENPTTPETPSTETTPSVPQTPTETPNSATTEIETETAVNSDWWEGCWYGWWAIKNGSGIYQEASDLNLVWDAFAEIQTNGAELGHVTIWDTETSKSFALISAEVLFEASAENSIMTTQFGQFFYGNTWLENFTVVPMSMDESSWRVDPENSSVSHFEHMMEITGHYASPENPDDSFDYYIYLRPWGTLWDDVRDGDTSNCLYSDMMPLYYDDWYLPLLNLGCEQPANSFAEGIEVINEQLGS